MRRRVKKTEGAHSGRGSAAGQKRNLATTWTDLEGVRPHEARQKDVLSTISLTNRVSKVKQNKKHRHREQTGGSRGVGPHRATRGGWGGGAERPEPPAPPGRQGRARTRARHAPRPAAPPSEARTAPRLTAGAPDTSTRPVTPSCPWTSRDSGKRGLTHAVFSYQLKEPFLFLGTPPSLLQAQPQPPEIPAANGTRGPGEATRLPAPATVSKPRHPERRRPQRSTGKRRPLTACWKRSCFKGHP